MPAIVQYWDSAIAPALIEERMSGWRQTHANWSYLRFDRESAAAWFFQTFGLSCQVSFLDVRIPAMQADIFRVAYLLTCGGIWVDAGTICKAPFTNWLDLTSPLLLLRRSHQVHPEVCSALIYAALPGHPLLQMAWSRISSLLYVRAGHKLYQQFGPGVFRDLIATGDYQNNIEIISIDNLSSFLTIGSSREATPGDQHWSIRKGSESLYFSQSSSSS